MKKVVMLTTDQKLDRRIILEARSLCRIGYPVTILAPPWPEAKEGYNHEPFNLVRIGNRANGTSRGQNVASPLTLYRLYHLLKKSGRFVQPHLHLIRSFFRGYVANIERLYFRLFFQHAVQAGGSVYHVHDPQPLAAGWYAADKVMARLIYDSHELFAEQEFLAAEKRKWRQIEAHYIPRVDRVITINNSIARELEKRYGICPPMVVRNCESREHREKMLAGGGFVLRDRLGLKRDSRLILYQGGIIPNRNLKSLIGAMAFVGDARAVLILLGSGELQGKLRGTVKKLGLNERVFLLPGVPQEELLSITAQASLGVIPYSATCLNTLYSTPNKLFEYIAAGIPLLVSDLPELRNIVEIHDLGWVADFGSPEKIAAAIEHALRGESELERRRKNAALAFETLCWEEEEKKLISLYQNL